MTIVVTGLGAVTALGKSARATWDALLRDGVGERGFRELSLFDPGEVKSRLVAEVTDLDVTADSRTSQLALLAAREAIADAQLDVGAQRTGLVVGGTTAGMFETESLLATLLSTPVGSSEREAALAKMLSHPLSAPTDFLAKALGPFARARSLSSACSSGANAIVVGALWLELGLVDAVVCGAADSLCRVIVAGFNALGAVDPEGARPFDKHRRGLTLGEGAGFVVLERGPAKRAKCSLLGWSALSEAHHITNPESTGTTPARAMKAALERAGVSADEVDFVDAHGTGTPLNDPMETRGLAQVFGARLAEVPVSSQKGMIGHTLAAAGAIEAVITAFALTEQTLPPTGGLGEADAECTLRHVRVATRAHIDVAVTSSFGFGGMDTVLVFGRPERAAPARPRARDVFVHGVAAITAAGLVSGADVAGIPAGTGRGQVVNLPPDALDAEKARRLDRTSRMAAVVARAAGASEQADATSLVLGVAFGAVDATADFMRRLRDKGARLVRPADFPSLVPSSPAGYVSIYLGLGGPSLVVADLGASGECALAQAFELVASGEAARVCAAAIEEKSAIVEGALSVIFAGAGADTRSEGGAALTLSASEDGALARIRGIWSWLDGEASHAGAIPSPPAGAIVVTAGAARPPFWRECPHVSCAAAGAHEAVGAIAAAVAVAKVARGEVPAALFFGSARGSSYAGIVLPK